MDRLAINPISDFAVFFDLLHQLNLLVELLQLICQL